MTLFSRLNNLIKKEQHKKFLIYLNNYENKSYPTLIAFYLEGIKKKLVLLFVFQFTFLIVSPILNISYATAVILNVTIFLGYLYNYYLSKSRLYLNRKLLYSLYSLVLFEDFLFFLALERNLYNAIVNIVEMQIYPISKAFNVILKKAILLNSVEEELIEFAKYVPSENFKNAIFSTLALTKIPLEIETLDYYLEFRKENLLFYTKITLSYGFTFFLLIFLTLFVSLVNPFNFFICLSYFLFVVLLESFMEKLVVFKNTSPR